MTEQDVFKALREFVTKQPTKATAAHALGITPQYLNDIWHRRRPVGPLAPKLGFRKLDDQYERVR